MTFFFLQFPKGRVELAWWGNSIMRGSKVRCTAFLASRYMKLMGATTTIEQRFCLYHHGRLSTRDVVKANQKAMKKRRSDNKTIIGTLSWFVCPLWFALLFSVPTSLNIPPIIRTILLTVHFMQSIRISLSTLTTPLIFWCCPLFQENSTACHRESWYYIEGYRPSLSRSYFQV